MKILMIQHYGLMGKRPLKKGSEHDLDERTAKLIIAMKAGKKVAKG